MLKFHVEALAGKFQECNFEIRNVINSRYMLTKNKNEHVWNFSKIKKECIPNFISIL